jgi:hypothetical protein
MELVADTPVAAVGQQSAFFQTLGPDAEPGTIPVQHFGLHGAPVDEHEQRTTHWIPAHGVWIGTC